MSASDIDEEERDWLKLYAAEVTTVFGKEFALDAGASPISRS